MGFSSTIILWEDLTPSDHELKAALHAFIKHPSVQAFQPRSARTAHLGSTTLWQAAATRI